MCNKVKSEKHSAETGAQIIAIFLASLKLVREEASGQLSYRDIKCLTSHESNHLHEGGHSK